MYDPNTDSVVAALRAEGEADPDVLGIVMTGSRALGVVSPESDYDLAFVVTDEAMARYERDDSTPARVQSVDPPIGTADIWHESPRSLQLENVTTWMLPAWAGSRVVYDRTGETTALIDALRRMPEERARQEVAAWYDGYLNALYRSLKCWRRGNVLGGRLEAVESINPLLTVLFGLERQWRPYSSRLPWYLDTLAGQGWESGEVADILLDLTTTGDPARQQVYARRITALLRDRGFGEVYDSWEGQIDQVLGWHFE